MSPDSCPSPETLNDWAQGRLDEGRAEAIENHLEKCNACEQLSAKFHFIEPSQLQPGVGGFHTEEECSAAINRLIGAKNSDAEDAPAVRPWDTLTGAKIRDYQLIRQLGKGGMGTVYLAEHTQLKKQVAIKVLPYSAQEDPANINRFRREMRAVGQLDHPNIVQALDAGEDGGLYFLTMELIIGRDISDLSKGKRRFSIEAACEIVRQAAEGLQYVHDQGLIHRDIKPSNIMLTESKVRVKILDLGLALLPDSGSIDSITSDSQLVGTLEYMSPEQTETTEDLDHRIDIYSLGVTLYRLLTGSVPFRGPEYRKPMKRLKALTTTDPPSVATRRNNLPAGLVTLVDQMISRVPGERPVSMTEVATRIREFCPDSPLTEIPSAHVDSVELDAADFSNAKGPLNADTSPTECDTVVDRSALRDTAIQSRSRTPKLIAVLAVPIAMLLGVIWLRTNGTYVQIESDPSIQLTLDVLDTDNALANSFEIGTGQNLFWLATGKYKIRLPAEEKDRISVSKDRLVVERGGTMVVTVERKSKTENTDTTIANNAPAGTNAIPQTTVARPNWNWSKPVSLGAPIATEWKDDQPAFTADGLTLFFGSYCIPRAMGEGDRDLWMVTRPAIDQPWGNVKNLGSAINSAMKETHPTYHSPTRTLIFASNRGGGVGETDLWFSKLSEDGNSWSRPQSLGTKTNSGFIDEGPEISADGLLLYFSSTRPATTSGNNIWMSTRESVQDKWRIPKEVPNVNSNSDDLSPALSSDLLTLIFASTRTGGAGKHDLWGCTRSSIKEEWSPPFNLGPQINTEETDYHPAFSPVDNSLYWGSSRSGGLGGTDIWMAKRLPEK